MNSKYIAQSLATTGFAVIASSIAFELRPDLYASWQSAMVTLREPEVTPPGCKRLIVELDGHQTLVLARSTDHLAERIHWVTGRVVGAITEAPPRTPNQTKPISTVADNAAQRRAKLDLNL
ncbi:exported hypothetical protein [Thiomonas sp. CB3]|nr:exported hypothetical protein [Thiomonas sp. CB3]